MKVGFIGLGRMGGHMASNVIKAGFETYVSDLVPDLVKQKVEEGAIGCANNQEVASKMDIGFTMLPNGAIVEAVELSEKRFFVGVQFHPEFKSRPNHPHPLFVGLISASLEEETCKRS